MAVAKRAKKFRQKHLSDKLEQKKREKKHAQLQQTRKSKKRATAAEKAAERPARTQAPSLDVEEQELFDADPNAEPSFAKYLSDSENDAEIAAEEQAYLNGDDVSSDSDGTENAGTKKHAKFPMAPSVIDLGVIQQWKDAMASSPAPLKAIVRAAQPEMVERMANEQSLDALRELLLENVPAMVAEQFPNPDSFKGMRPTFKKLADLLSQWLVDLGNSDGQALLSIVSAVRKLLPYFTQFSREFKSLAKGLVAVVVRADRDDQAKLVAFNSLREIVANEATTGELAAVVAKQAYASLVKAAAHTNSYTLESLNLAKNLFATLFTLQNATDRVEIYQLAFQQIRQLALHLKTALDKTKHADYDVKVVYTWQFVQSLDFWSRAVSLSPGLEALIHPLCQITLRVITLVPAQQYLPLRFYLVRSLVRLGRHTGVYIPLAPSLLEAVLHSSVFSKPGKPASLQQPDFEALLHVPSGYLGTAVYQNAVLDEFVDVFVEALVLYTKSIAFPELVAPITVVLRRFAKHHSTGHPKVNRTLLSLCERLEANAAFIEKQRARVNYGPRDKAAVDKFLSDLKWEDTPLGKEAVVRLRVREERRKLVALAKQEDETHRELEQFSDSSSEDEEPEDEAEIEEALNELEAA